MATVAASAVTILETWYSDGVSGRKLKNVRATVALSSQGSDANPIPIDVFGLTAAETVSAFVKDDNSAIYPGSRSFDGSKVYPIDSHAPVDLTGNFKVIVKGKY